VSVAVCRPPCTICGAAGNFGEQKGLPQNAYRWRVAMARVLESQGDLTAALALLDEAQRL
jgi:LuxR family maltose regulon positive regulatory protein